MVHSTDRSQSPLQQKVSIIAILQMKKLSVVDLRVQHRFLVSFQSSSYSMDQAGSTACQKHELAHVQDQCQSQTDPFSLTKCMYFIKMLSLKLSHVN